MINNSVDEEQEFLDNLDDIDDYDEEYFNKALTKRLSSVKELKNGETLNDNGLSFHKMKLKVNKTHPRKYRNGEYKQLPLLGIMGSVKRIKNGRREIREGEVELGMAVVQYFMLVKGMIFFFVVASIMSIPLMYIY